MAAIEAAGPRHHHGHHQPHAPLPASPTLTNPDMILPEYERSVSPTPNLDGSGREHSPLMMWKNAHAGASSADMHHIFGVGNPNGQQIDHPYGPTGPITPTTPIIYGNGTMLSDIGEVTEAESTLGRPSPGRYKVGLRKPEPLQQDSDVALRSSPTMGTKPVTKKQSLKGINAQRERRSSLESNSTITTQEQANVFADFDDTASVGDSVFQGDDEESMASSYVEGTPAVDYSTLRIPKHVESVDRLSTYSTASLSRRAEEILANAKKRLTTMEGNLNRARTSLPVSSSYGSDASTPSPPLQRASTAVFARESNHSTPSPSHSRMTSDIAIRNGLPYRISMPRSQSAMGAAGGYRQSLTLSKSADRIEGGPDSARPAYRVTPPRDSSLQPLTEDGVAQLGGLDDHAHEARMDSFLSPTFGSMSENGSSATRGMQRPTSVSQMRDIKDQMRDLKGKISSLREQARVDSMKRRSLQSLRTPSPFTHSQIDQWYAEPPSNRNSTISNGNVPASKNLWNGEETSVDGEAKEEPVGDGAHAFVDEEESVYEDAVYEDAEMVSMHRASDLFPDRRSIPLPEARFGDPGEQEEQEQEGSDVVTEDGEALADEELPPGFQDAIDLGYESESGESMYHDTVQHQVSHEDREDAFDYEHFFLHSALGTMSHARMLRRGSTDSFTSEDSVETTRGPVLETTTDGAADSLGRTSPKSRRNSSTSISTIDTFATAAEELRSRSRRSGQRTPEGRVSCSFGMPSPKDVRSRSKGRPPTVRSLSVGARSANASMLSMLGGGARDSDESIVSIPEEGSQDDQISSTNRRPSAFRRPVSFSASHSMHRPSVSSLSSTGTNRSFPLINKPKENSGILTPNSSPDEELKTISNVLLTETANLCEQHQRDEGLDGSKGVNGVPRTGLANSSLASPPLQALLREDKYLVERLVAGLGKCVLGLTENGRASAESRMYRRRIDAARRILEGLDEDGEV